MPLKAIWPTVTTEISNSKPCAIPFFQSGNDPPREVLALVLAAMAVKVHDLGPMTDLDIHTAFSSASAGELRPRPLIRVIYRVRTHWRYLRDFLLRTVLGLFEVSCVSSFHGNHSIFRVALQPKLGNVESFHFSFGRDPHALDLVHHSEDGEGHAERPSRA